MTFETAPYKGETFCKQDNFILNDTSFFINGTNGLIQSKVLICFLCFTAVKNGIIFILFNKEG